MLFRSKMNGYLVLEALKQEPRTSNIPVLIMSAKAQEQDIKLARSLGAADYLVKPFHPKQLVQIIQSTLNERRSVSTNDQAQHSDHR